MIFIKISNFHNECQIFKVQNFLIIFNSDETTAIETMPPNDEVVEQQPPTEKFALPTEAEISFYEEPFPTKKIEYSRDVLLSYQLMSANNEIAVTNAAEIDEKFSNIIRFNLTRGLSRKSRQRTKNVSEIVVNVIDRPNQGSPSENDDENSFLRLKEGVLNKTRLLQMKLEEMKMKVAATSE